MHHICVVAQDDHMANAIGVALGREENCHIHEITELDLPALLNTSSPPDLLLLSLDVLQQPARHFLEKLNRIHPETTVIAIAPNQNASSAEDLSLCGIDEIIVQPIDSLPTSEVVQGILTRIAVLNYVFGLQEKLRHEMRQGQIVAKSMVMRRIIHRLPQLAACTSTVLITGETGTGKELIARAIHYLGSRAGQPFITLDCGAIPESLVENELFGHVRGAYTDASSQSKGMIQEAEGGTLFLDEVEALPLPAQSKFLRLLQEKQYKPLGQSKYQPMNVRIVAATNIDLAKAIGRGAFREDLYYRLKVVPLFIPPLRERKADIVALLHHFLQVHGGDRTPRDFPEETLHAWMNYDWPGNVRELENKVQEWLTTSPADNLLSPPQLTAAAPKALRPLAQARDEALRNCDLTYLHELLTHTAGNISASARLAGIDRKNLRKLLKKYGMDAHTFRRKEAA